VATRHERDILEGAVQAIAEQAAKADELVKEAASREEAITRSLSTRRCSASSFLLNVKADLDARA
jgi:hypothetical protein